MALGGVNVAAGNGITLNSVTANGNIQLTADSLSLTANPTSITTAGNVSFAPYSASTTIGVAGGAGALQISTSLLNDITAGSITIGGSGASGVLTASSYSWAEPVTLLDGAGGINVNGIQTMGSNSFLAQTMGAGDITLGASGGVTTSARNTAITLASGRNFINDAGSGALSASSGRSLIYTMAPGDVVAGGLSEEFIRFSCSYGASCPGLPFTGNGLIYSSALPATVSKAFLYPSSPNAQAQLGLSGPTDFANLITMDARLAAEEASPFLSDAGQ